MRMNVVHLRKQAGLYCQQTVERQLLWKTYEPLDWTNNALQLASYYMNLGAWSQAVQCIIAADKMLNTVPKEKLEDEPGSTLRPNWYITWGKFCLSRLSEGKARLIGERCNLITYNCNICRF